MGSNRRSDPTSRVDFHHCYQLIHANSHRHKIRNHCDMYIRVKKRHDNHDFSPHALASPPNLFPGWGKREWQSRAPSEISTFFFFFFFFRPSVPCVAYVDIKYYYFIPKGVKPQWRIRTTGIVHVHTVSYLCPGAQKRSSFDGGFCGYKVIR